MQKRNTYMHTKILPCLVLRRCLSPLEQRLHDIQHAAGSTKTLLSSCTWTKDWSHSLHFWPDSTWCSKNNNKSRQDSHLQYPRWDEDEDEVNLVALPSMKWSYACTNGSILSEYVGLAVSQRAPHNSSVAAAIFHCSVHVHGVVHVYENWTVSLARDSEKMYPCSASTLERRIEVSFLQW